MMDLFFPTQKQANLKQHLEQNDLTPYKIVDAEGAWVETLFLTPELFSLAVKEIERPYSLVEFSDVERPVVFGSLFS